MIRGCFRRAGRKSIISAAVFYDTELVLCSIDKVAATYKHVFNVAFPEIIR